MFTMVTMANHRGSSPRPRITGKKIGTVMSMMEMGSMNAAHDEDDDLHAGDDDPR